MVSFKPETEERAGMIITGVLLFYLLVVGFVYYFYFMGKLPSIALWVIVLAFTAIYCPRFLIIKKLYLKDIVKVEDDGILVNGNKYEFSKIQNFEVYKKKPVIVFFLNNKAVVYNEADFILNLKNRTIKFTVTGSEKAELLKEYLNNLLM